MQLTSCFARTLLKAMRNEQDLCRIIHGLTTNNTLLLANVLSWLETVAADSVFDNVVNNVDIDTAKHNGY